jgi:hypothetical protein
MAEILTQNLVFGINLLTLVGATVLLAGMKTGHTTMMGIGSALAVVGICVELL